MISYFLMVPFIGREPAESELRLAPIAETTATPCAPLDRKFTGR
jgi:hypothetical protein